MSYWSDLLALNPLFLWKFDETSGTVAADATGGGSPGAYINTPTLGAPSIIPNAPLDKSVYFDGTNEWVDSGNHASNATSDVTMVVWLKPETGAQRALGGKEVHVQIYINADGTLLFYCSPPWTAVTTGAPDALANATAYMLAWRKRAGKQSIWINGVKRIEGDHAGSLQASGNFWRFGNMTGPLYKGWAQGFAVWTATSLSDAEILALYDAGMTAPNDPPTTPGVFTAPLAAAVVDAAVLVEWGASTDPDADPVTYEGDYSVDDGDNWLPLFAAQSGTSYAWDTSALAPGDVFRVRVRALSPPSEVSDYRTSDAFTIQHASALPVTTLAVLARTDFSVLLEVSFADADEGMLGEHGATEYEIDLAEDDFSTPVIGSGWLTDEHARERKWFTAMPSDTAFHARARTRDAGGQEGAWCDPVAFRTRRIMTLGLGDGFNQDRNLGTAGAGVTAEYGEISGGGFVPTYPDLQPGIDAAPWSARGMRVRWNSSVADYVQPTEPGIVGNTVRYGGTALNPVGPVSFMLVFEPMYFDPAAKSLLFGSESWWIYRDGMSIHARGGVLDGSFVESFLSVAGMLNYENNILVGTYLYEGIDTECMLATVPVEERVTTPGTFALWLNGTKAHIGTLGGASLFPFVPGSGCLELSNSFETRDMSFALGPAPHNYLWLGTQSTDGAKDPDDSNYFSFAGMFREFAWWNNRLLSDADAAALRTAYISGPDALADVVLDMGPVLYDRLNQPRQPAKPALAVAVA